MANLQRGQGRPVDAPDRLRDFLDIVYQRYHRREMVPPDPLQCLYAYDDPGEREVAALLAASLAVGRAQSIVHQVSGVLSRMGPKPASFLKEADAEDMQRVCRGFRYRFFAEDELRAFLEGVRAILRLWGSLESAMAQCLARSQGDVLRALDLFAGMLECGAPDEGPRRNRLLASPAGGSACKRWHLFLRWMVRCDAVDPAGGRACSLGISSFPWILTCSPSPAPATSPHADTATSRPLWKSRKGFDGCVPTIPSGTIFP